MSVCACMNMRICDINCVCVCVCVCVSVPSFAVFVIQFHDIIIMQM